MAAQWLTQSGEWSSRVGVALEPLLQKLSKPENQRRMRQLVLVLLLLWGLFALVRLVWIFFPIKTADQPAAVPSVINPVNTQQQASAVRELDIERMRAWHLFGEAGAAEVPVPVKEVVNEREGIEKDARKTRLSLVLRGIVASTEDGLGHAIIEHRSQQAVYAVDDKLPVSGRVTLAKVMPTQVILNNGGTYERLELFDRSKLGSPTASAPPPRPAATPQPKVEQISSPEVTALASDYRKRLFKDPQSLATVVNISAVRENGSLRGYRVAPGRDKDQFKVLGFERGDLVTSVNGVELNNPANTMRLYNMMRSATEATFELERGGEPMTLSVSLDSIAAP